MNRNPAQGEQGPWGSPPARVLPRFKSADAMPFVGLEPGQVVAAYPILQGHRKEVEEAQAAAAVLAKTVGIAKRETASALDAAMRTAQGF